MNILIFNWRDIKHSWTGGGEVYVFEQASRWVKAGHKVTLFCGQDIDNKLPDTEIIKGIHIYRKGGRFTLYLWAIWYFFTRFRGKTDIIVDVENGIPFFTPLFSNVPVVSYVYHVHGKQFFYELSPPLSYIGYVVERYIFPLLYRNVPIVAISQTTKQQLMKIGLPAKNISIIYSGINGTKKKQLKRTKKFTNPTILYLGRIKKYKRVGLLVSLFEKVIERVPKARLIIAGWGTEASHLTDLIMKNRLRRKIGLFGPVSNQEKKLLLSKSWVFVNPSIGEGWSIAVIEANLYGTPAAAFHVPGVAESIRHKKTGMLAINEEQLVEHIVTILKNRKFREKLNKNALTWATRFSWDRSAHESLRVLKKANRTH